MTIRDTEKIDLTAGSYRGIFEGQLIYNVKLSCADYNNRSILAMIFDFKSTSGHIYDKQIDINKIGELIDLYTTHDSEIIITKLDGRWTIEIYDDFRE